MKKTVLLLLILAAITGSAAAQGSKWFISAVSGIPFGGPAGSMKNHFKKVGLNGTESFAVIFIGGTTKYPVGTQAPPLLLKFGKRMTEKKSWFVVTGLSSSGDAEGFKEVSTDMVFPIIFTTSGVHLRVKYQVLQLGAGYQYHYAKSRTKLAVAPSLFLYKYQNTSAFQKQQHAALRPGVAFSGRLPLGKERKLFGVDLVADLNLVPPVKMKTLSNEDTFNNQKVTATLNSSSVNLVHGMLGLAFSFRR